MDKGGYLCEVHLLHIQNHLYQSRGPQIISQQLKLGTSLTLHCPAYAPPNSQTLHVSPLTSTVLSAGRRLRMTLSESRLHTCAPKYEAVSRDIK
jgi:hypothetical protein